MRKNGDVCIQDVALTIYEDLCDGYMLNANEWCDVGIYFQGDSF